MSILKLDKDFSNIGEIQEILESKQAWLCDVFDTVLSRRLYEVNLGYYIIFDRIEKCLPKEFIEKVGRKYKDERIEAGHAARKDNPYHTLIDISRELPFHYAAIPFFEHIIDKQLLVPSRFGRWFIPYATQQITKVKYFLSDVYYTSEVVADFLYKAYSKDLLQEWTLYTSATDRIAKCNGTMYDYILEQLEPIQISNGETIMISDRMEDLEIASNYLIDGILIDPELRGING